MAKIKIMMASELTNMQLFEVCNDDSISELKSAQDIIHGCYMVNSILRGKKVFFVKKDAEDFILARARAAAKEARKRVKDLELKFKSKGV